VLLPESLKGYILIKEGNSMGLFYEGTAAEADQIAGHENDRQYISHDPRPDWRDF
jgi:hypothetical protein